jgi:pyridoxine/pyridoxamine 5'-phosphate oxidase
LCLVNENCGKRTGEDMDIRRTVLLADANEELLMLFSKIKSEKVKAIAIKQLEALISLEVE